jgi:T4-like virus Myoviridae tail sheath stabiliser
MLNNFWFYNRSIKNVIIAFGTIFSNIELRRYDSNNSIIQTQKVPIHYANRDRLLSRALEVSDLEKDTLIGQRYPQMAFSMEGMSYDKDRKLNTLNKLYSCSVDGKSSTLVPVPYTLDFELNIITISNDDMLQIVEQIVPYFTPTFTIKIVSIIGFPSTEVPITLNGINIQDNYDGSYVSETREIIYTLRFSAAANVFGSVTDNSGKLIRSIIINLNTDMSNIGASVLSVKPVAKTDKNNDGLINDADSLLLTPTDDFGFENIWR